MSEKLQTAIDKAQSLILSQQFPDGYWWYTLEANDSILAEYLLFHRYMGIPLENWRAEGLIAHILSGQGPDGSWALYHGGPGSVGASTECYFALKLYGVSVDSEALTKARQFILSHGGALKSWVFTRIHLAMFGILPWDAVPAMPIGFVLLPSGFPITIYEFSSWARASIVPLLVIVDRKKTVSCDIGLDELFLHPPSPEEWRFKSDRGRFSFESWYIQFDKILKHLPCPQWLKKKALSRAESWIVDHLLVTEDIFPALAYGAVALELLGHDPASGALAKALAALRSFQQRSSRTSGVPALPQAPQVGEAIYQQCSISPTWDSAWAGYALIASGADPKQARYKGLLKAGQWLLQMQIFDYYGDWFFKNKTARPGGWGFEFENKAFPDVDDTIQIVQFLHALPLPEKRGALERALSWVLSMQSKNGGWAAFDKDNTRTWVNRIPFSDHKACLDAPTADITARVLPILVAFGYTLSMTSLSRAVQFIKHEQSAEGPWSGRWGVNYLYGTWCVLDGLARSGISPTEPFLERAIAWLLSVQNPDGGWSESCESYTLGRFVPLSSSTASQTAWAVLALLACGLEKSEACERGIRFLLDTQRADGGWDETAYTGTGFPGHFYIRYHGYRYYFPLFALGRYESVLKKAAAF